MRPSLTIAVCLVVALAIAPAAWADQDYTGASGGNYDVGSNWSGGSVPTNESAFIRNGATVTLNASEPNIVDLRLGGPVGDPSSSGTLHVLSGALLTSAGTFAVGEAYDGSVDQSDGAITTALLQMSYGGGNSSYALSGGSLISDGTGGIISLGRMGGTAQFVQNGGYLFLRNAQVYVGAGTDNVTTDGGYAEFTMTNGSVMTVGSEQLVTGRDSGRGTFNLKGGYVEVPYKLLTGYRGSGVFNQEGGRVYTGALNGEFSVGMAHNSKAGYSAGEYNLKAGVLEIVYKARIGNEYNATYGPGVGVVNVQGGTFLCTSPSQRLQIGYKGGQGCLNVTAGSAGVGYDITLADAVSGGAIPQGTLKVGGTGLVTTSKVFGGRHGAATIDISGGSLATTSLLRVGGGLDGDTTDPNCVGRMTMSGGSVTIGTNLSVGYKHGTGTVELSGGVLQVGGRTIIGDPYNVGSGRGTFVMTGGKFEATGIDPVWIGQYSSSTGGGVADGTMILTGGTFRAPGIRMLNDCDPASSSDSAKLKIGAGADVEVSTEFRIYEADSAVEMEIVSASKNAQLRSLGGVTLGSSKATLDVNTTGYRPREGDKFTLFTTGAYYAVTGNFISIGSNITLGLQGSPAFAGAIVTDPNTSVSSYVVTFQGLTAGDCLGDHDVDGGDLALMGGNWMLSGKTWADGDFNGDGKVDGGDLALMGGNWMWSLPAPPEGAPVPEPATMALLALGGGALLRRRRR